MKKMLAHSHHFSALVDVTIHADPYTGESSDPFHDLTVHHFQNVEKA